MTDQAIPTTIDAFLGGALEIEQPVSGYRAATDPVLLAAAVPAHSNQTVLDLGCGVGTAALCLGRRVPNVTLKGVEIQPDYAALAKSNAQRNGLRMSVVTADLADLPAALRQQVFDHVILNPPFFRRDTGSQAKDPGREIAFAEDTPLSTWLDVAARRLAPKGHLTLIHKAERLPDLLRSMPDTIGNIRIWPLSARSAEPPGRVILTARKGGRAAFSLQFPQIIHEGTADPSGSAPYAPAVEKILRMGAAWPWITD